jgi:hypothetical protein
MLREVCKASLANLRTPFLVRRPAKEPSMFWTLVSKRLNIQSEQNHLRDKMARCIGQPDRHEPQGLSSALLDRVACDPETVVGQQSGSLYPTSLVRQRATRVEGASGRWL